jgi:hypothetical protein
MEEELYMFIRPEDYRFGKSNVLKGQADLLNSVKRIYNLKVLARQKHDLKKQLSRLLNSAIKDISDFQERLPNPKIPKMIQKKVEEVKVDFKFEEKKPKERNSSLRDSIDIELRDIQEKLKRLNN